jgi:hypothetical protein
MTWGQLRMQLQTSAPEASLDLIDEYLNTRYTAVLDSTDWIGRKAHAMVQTQAAYQSGTDTVTLTVGSASAVGIGTTWTSAVTGQRFYRPGDTVIYTAAYVSGTSLTLDRPYEGTGYVLAGTVYALSPYVFMQHIYPLPADLDSVVTVLDPITEVPLESMTKDGLDASVGSRTTLGYPQIWAQYDDSSESTPPVLHQIEFYPPPLNARGFPLEYLRNPNRFDGSSTSLAPLPFVSDAVLLAGARADIQLHLKDFTAAKGYQALFEVELARLLRVEHQQRRVKTSLKMADRFTRHRLARAARGMASAWRGGTPGGPN